ncbi:MAG: hypothetical protein EXR09_09075 [Acetobacteraceae bacterium]|nr:hypothetical protein [Acetobacteraceae bacterium]
MALCLYYALLGAGRVLWPVLAIILRAAIVLGGVIFLSRSQAAGPEHFYWPIAAGMTPHSLVTAAAIRLGGETGYQKSDWSGGVVATSTHIILDSKSPLIYAW